MERFSLLFACMLAGIFACKSGDAPDPESDRSWAEAVVAADPAFGGGESFAVRLSSDPFLLAGGDPEQRSEYLALSRIMHDERARELVLRTVDESLARGALGFLESGAGEAYAEAELWAVSASSTQPDDFPMRTADLYADRDAVGAAAVRRLSSLREAAERSPGSVSPIDVSLLLGASRVQPRHADAIREFFASDSGTRWLAVRLEVWPGVQERFAAFRSDALERGFVRPSDPSLLEDLVLPAARGDRKW